jgi:4-hydroxybenzoate polyprenyltransferase
VRVKTNVFDGPLRTLLVLGRISNLPTVWSNLIAGWVLARGTFDLAALSLLLLGGSLLYIGGMYLNDYCDTEFDVHYCPRRPIPAGKISRRAVGWLTNVWFACGLACLAFLGWTTAALALMLVAAIVLYDFRHKNVVWAPPVMGICRVILYPLAASATANPVPSWHVIFKGIALGIYVVGITYLARGESRVSKLARWPFLLLLLPVMISVSMCDPRLDVCGPVGFFCLPLLFWLCWLLFPFHRRSNQSVGRLVSGLLASIVLVDMIAVAPILRFEAAYLFTLFVIALLLQRIIPAT